MWYPISKYGIDEYTKDIKRHQKTSMATTSVVGVTYPSFAGVLCLVVAPPTGSRCLFKLTVWECLKMDYPLVN